MLSFVITLKSESDYKKTDEYNSLIKNGIDPIVVPGVRATESDIKEFPLRPKNIIGSKIAHLNAWKTAKEKYSLVINSCPVSLILEDDAYINTKGILKKIKKIQDSSFDIYKLHTDFNGQLFISVAAYLIKNDRIEYLLNNYYTVFGYVDIDLYLLYLRGVLNMKVHSKNLFKTNENISVNRKESKEKQIIHNLFKNIKISSDSDKTVEHVLNYPLIRIRNNEYTVYIIVLLFFIIIFSIFRKWKIVSGLILLLFI